MGTPLEPLVEHWYEERSEAHLAKVLHEARRVAERAAIATGMRDADVDDVAQHAAQKLAASLHAPGRVDRPGALVWRIAENKARDVHRQRARQGERRARLERDPTVTEAQATSPEEMYLHEENAGRLQDIVRDAVSAAPASYKRVIDLHFMQGVTIEEIAERYYAASIGEVDTGDVAAVHLAKRRARNLVDQHLTRGKRWIAQRIADALAEEDT